ncbi:hypothetical protein F4811DRAFT_551448 [Daldinia bambusicola]|nr:hypothetical protein F4811DRAFT_551448 [Daldinia bambusicola]
MDFAALMSKELAKATGTTSPSPSDPSSSNTNNSNNSSTSNKKYLRRAEIEAQREAAYRAEQKALEEKRAAKAAEKRKREEEAAEEARAREEKRRKLEEETRRRREEQAAEEERRRRKRLGLPELPKGDGGSNGSGSREGSAGVEGEEDIPEEELVAKLRGLGEPATLFGETHRAKLRRYRRLTTVVTAGPIPTTLRLVEEKDMKVDGTIPQDKAGRQYLFRQLASYFTMVLREWEAALAREENRDTFAGKAAVNAMVSSRDNMVPLFRKFEKGELEDDILKPVVEIVQAAQERRYVDANDGYLRLSIGKAAWPIGVTMVGIHERSAREKLHDGERGHIMSDEYAGPLKTLGS